MDQNHQTRGVEGEDSDTTVAIFAPKHPGASLVPVSTVGEENVLFPPSYEDLPTFAPLTSVPVTSASAPSGSEQQQQASITIGDLLHGPPKSPAPPAEPLALSMTSSPLYARRHLSLYAQLCQPVAPPPTSVPFGPNSWLKERWGMLPSPSPLASPASMESPSPLPSPSPQGQPKKPIFSFEPGALALAGAFPQGRRRSEPVISLAKRDEVEVVKVRKPRGGSRKRKAVEPVPMPKGATTTQLTLDKWMSPVVGMGLASIQEELIQQGLVQLERENREKRELIQELMSVVFKELMIKIECCKILIAANAMNAKMSIEGFKIMFRSLGLQFDEKPVFLGMGNEIVPRPMPATSNEHQTMAVPATLVEQAEEQKPKEQEGIQFYVTLPVQNQIHIDPSNCYIFDLDQHTAAPHTN